MIKICGVTTDGCIDCCVSECVDAVGLNFYPPSPRYVTIDQARRLRSRVSFPMQVIGVFVRPTVETLRRTVEAVKLDAVQLYGTDEAYWQEFQPPPAPLWLAQGVESLSDVELLKTQVRLCKAMNITVSAAVVDAKVASQHGGTGQPAPWHLLQETTWELPIILAGGLHPGNVRQAIGQVRPTGVDVASGVESSPGVKDAALVQQFVRHARSAFRSDV